MVAVSVPSAAESDSARSYTLVRTFAVPARILFKAMSAPEHVIRWFGPKACPMTLCEMDFRVGGRYRFAIPHNGAPQYFGGEYLDIVRDRRIAFTNTFEAPGAETMIVTFDLDERDGKTVLTHHTLFGSVAMKNLHLGMGYENGLASSIDGLTEVATELAR